MSVVSFIALSFSAVAQEISVRASVTEATVPVGEPFEYIIEVQGSVGVESIQLGRLSGVEKTRRVAIDQRQHCQWQNFTVSCHCLHTCGKH